MVVEGVCNNTLILQEKACVFIPGPHITMPLPGKGPRYIRG